MAGFSKRQAYFVPRALLQLPHPIGWYEDKLLPELATWREQAAHPTQGDKSVCSQKFLQELIPYFLEVAVQDGIYFVRDFPNHPFSQLLKVRSNLLYYSSECVVFCHLCLSNYQIYMVLEQNSRLRSLGYSS
jgi:hypothetical protein